MKKNKLKCLGLSPFPVIVTSRIIACVVEDSYKPSFATITGQRDNPINATSFYCFVGYTTPRSIIQAGDPLVSVMPKKVSLAWLTRCMFLYLFSA